MAQPQHLSTVHRIQTTMSASYSAMSLWLLLHPSSALTLSLNPAYLQLTRTTLLLARCFGAQALTTGLLLGVAPMNARSFRFFSIAMVPYLLFNAWFLGGPGKGMFTGWLWLDCVGNLGFMVGSAWCAWVLGEAERGEKAEK